MAQLKVPAIPSGATPTPRIILADVTNAADDPANSGIARVTRQLCRLLLARADLAVVLVIWDSDRRSYRLLEARHRATLARYGGVVDPIALFAHALDYEVDRLTALLSRNSLGPVLFIPELALHELEPRLAWAAKRGLPTAGLLYDVIPIDFPHYCDDPMNQAFPIYLRSLLLCDRLFCISRYALERAEAFVMAVGAARTAVMTPIPLPGQFSDAPRVISAAGATADIHILSVGTLEPRKNHLTLFDAWRRLRARRLDLSVRLTVVGRCWRSIGEEAVKLAAEDDRFVYAGVIGDEEVRALYGACHFSVYPSLVEGFGLPILESLWLGRPCLVHQEGVTAELARPGGCVLLDMTDAQALSEGLERMADDGALRDRLSREAVDRPIKDWSAYSAEIAAQLRALGAERGP